MDNEHSGQGPVERMVRPGAEAPRWWKCDTHGPAKDGAWGCPACVRELREEAATFHMAYRIKCDEETKAQAVEIERLRAALVGLLQIHTDPVNWRGKYGKELERLLDVQQAKIDAMVAAARAALGIKA